MFIASNAVINVENVLTRIIFVRYFSTKLRKKTENSSKLALNSSYNFYDGDLLSVHYVQDDL